MRRDSTYEALKQLAEMIVSTDQYDILEVCYLLLHLLRSKSWEFAQNDQEELSREVIKLHDRLYMYTKEHEYIHKTQETASMAGGALSEGVVTPLEPLDFREPITALLVQQVFETQEAEAVPVMPEETAQFNIQYEKWKIDQERKREERRQLTRELKAASATDHEIELLEQMLLAVIRSTG